jgi:5-methylcytosine-specific restriction protein A
MRESVLRRDAYVCRCEHCKQSGRVRSATEVDHVVAKERAKALGWTNEQIDSEANLQAINRECHIRKTLEDEGKSYRKPDRIGIDGFPIETV